MIQTFAFPILALLQPPAAGTPAPPLDVETPAVDLASTPSFDLDRPAHLPSLVWGDAKSVLGAPLKWEKEDWSRFAVAALAVAGTAVLLDRPLHDAVLRNEHDSWKRASRNLERFGSNYAIAVTGGFYLAGWIGGHEETRATGADAISASVITGLLMVPAMKFAAGRARPFQDKGTFTFKPLGGNASFPSGHTTEAFTVASVIAAHYPDTWVQITAYGFASLAGLSRIEQNAHWASDVVAGALIGTTVGRAVAHLNQRQGAKQHSRMKLVVAPDLRPRFQGIQVGFQF